VRFTPGTSWSEPGCVVASVATIAKVGYPEARKVAERIVGFDGSNGLDFTEGGELLDHYNISSTRHAQGSDWSDLPNLAIVSVRLEDCLHAVVFHRMNGKEIVWDYGRKRDPSEFQLADGDEYLEIHGRCSH
jgi:hypothetical protein